MENVHFQQTLLQKVMLENQLVHRTPLILAIQLISEFQGITVGVERAKSMLPRAQSLDLEWHRLP